MSVKREPGEPLTDESHFEQTDSAPDRTHAETSPAQQAVANEREALESGEESPG